MDRGRRTLWLPLRHENSVPRKRPLIRGELQDRWCFGSSLKISSRMYRHGKLQAFDDGELRKDMPVLIYPEMIADPRKDSDNGNY